MSAFFGIPVWSTDKKGAEKPNETQPEMENGPEDFQPEEEVFSIQELGQKLGTGIEEYRNYPEPNSIRQNRSRRKQNRNRKSLFWKPGSAACQKSLEVFSRRESRWPQTESGRLMGLGDGFIRPAEQKETILSWIGDEANQESVKLIFCQLGKIIRHILPRKGHGTVTFGFGEDPYLTGKVFMIAPFYPLYGEYLEVYPDFERQIFEAEGTGNGHIRIGVIIGYAIRLLFDSNIRKNIRAFMRR